MFAHVDFKFSCGVPAFPAVVVVAGAEVLFTGGAGEASAGCGFAVEEAEECAGEERDVRKRGRPANKAGDSDQDVDDDEVFGLDLEQEEHQELLFAEEDSEGSKQSEDTGLRACRGLHWRQVKDAGKGESCGDDASADDRQKIDFSQPFRAFFCFKVRADEPQRQHVEQDFKYTGVDERVGDKLPYLAAHDECGRQNKRAQQKVKRRGEFREQHQRKDG